MELQNWMTSRLARAVVASMTASLAAGLVAIGTVACDSAKTTRTSDSTGATKSEAEIAQAALDAEAAEEELTRTRKPASKSANRESVYVVQVGTFRVEANAQKVLGQLKAAGLPAFQKRIERDSENVLYTVRFEPTPSKTEAEKFVEHAKSLTGQNAMILSLGK